ncbi:DUF6333 family protein [Streptomyces sp. NBC_01304]|uniref:DUF6333 family protein n=1 Tax=Streptomyces sp. NBC_01304 TaxID=2903818 RepID=UPI002E11E73C|nr:DUF6333 family protein [Streptomyces sp. NBC_01304]
MSEDNFWTVPADREVRGHGEYTITLVRPPFPVGTGPSTHVTVKELAPHDPVRAREFAEAFGTVDAVLEELPLTDALPGGSPWTRADLDVITVGCWGNVIGISDPALVDNGNDCPVLEQTEALRERYPDARIIGSVDSDMGADHHEHTVYLPEGPTLHSEGWGGDRWDLTGDPHAVLKALGITAESLVGTDAELSEDPSDTNWDAFGALALGPWSPWGFPTPKMSAFRVRHTEGAVALMEEIWRLADWDA